MRTNFCVDRKDVFAFDRAATNDCSHISRLNANIECYFHFYCYFCTSFVIRIHRRFAANIRLCLASSPLCFSHSVDFICQRNSHFIQTITILSAAHSHKAQTAQSQRQGKVKSKSALIQLQFDTFILLLFSHLLQPIRCRSNSVAILFAQSN